MHQNLDDLRRTLTTACRVLAMEGLVEGTLGHVSARVGGNRMLIRGRAPHDRGVAFTAADDIRLVDFDGHGDDPADGYSLPNELPIHGEMLRARPEVGAVVHAHPPAVLICGVAGLQLQPIFGAFNIPALHMALDGVPVYPRSVLIRRPELARDMMEAMGDRPVCVLRGHGITVTGANVEQAIVRSLNLNALAVITLAVAQTGREATVVPPEDVAELPDLGSAFNDETAWRYYVAKAHRDGFCECASPHR